MQLKKVLATMLALAVCVPVVTTTIVSSQSATISTYASETIDNFEYTTNTSKGYVTITKYTGSDTDVVVPSEIDGYPVTAIGRGAFSGTANFTNNYQNNKKICNITLPDTITTIGEDAFRNCEGLHTINMPKELVSIDSWAFGNCYWLTDVTFYNKLTSIGTWAFANCDSFKNVILPDSVTTAGQGAFGSCDRIETVKLSSGITELEKYIFQFDDNLKEIIMPSSIKSVARYAFNRCNSVTDVYYYGTESDWKKISIGDANVGITSSSVTIHYNYVYTEDGEVTTTTTEPITTTTEPATTTTTEPVTTTTEPVTTTTVTEFYNNAINGVYGDVNGDGETDIIDLLILKKLVLGI